MPDQAFPVPDDAPLRRLAKAARRLPIVTPFSAAQDSLRDLPARPKDPVPWERQNAELRKDCDQAQQLLAKYTELYDSAPVGYFTLGQDGCIHGVNLTGANLVGSGRERLIGRSFARLIAPRERAAFTRFLQHLFSCEDRHTADFDLHLPKAMTRSVKMQAQRTVGQQECHVILTDVTLRHQVEEKVRVSEIRYRRLFEAAHDGVLLLDPTTCLITDANPFMTSLLGYSHAQLVGKQLFEIGLLRDETASREMFQRLKRQRQVRYEDLPLESRQGRHQEVEVVANLYQENGRDVIQCNIRDITVRKQAEAVLQGNEALFSALIEQAPVGVYVVDAHLRVQQVNSTALPAFQNIHPLVGRDFAEVVQVLWPKPLARQILQRFRHTLKTGEPYHQSDFAQRRRDTGQHEIYDWQVQRITLPAGELGVVCFFSNITERKHIEETQHRLEVVSATNHKLEQEIVRRKAGERSLKLSEQKQGRLAEQLRRLSHQILHTQEEERKRISRELHDVIAQTLVSINVSLATLTQHGVANPKTLRQKIRRTQKQVEKSVETVHRFAAELRPAMLDNLGLLPALTSYLKTFMTETGIRVTLKVHAAIEEADDSKRTVLYRIVQEALSNVAHHAGASQVTIRIQSLKQEGIRMDITDDGCGFDVAASGRPSQQKSHLGLLGMKERVEMVGGGFHITSVPGYSTTICVLIPLDPATPIQD